jgi:hypothetical protein
MKKIVACSLLWLLAGAAFAQQTPAKRGTYVVNFAELTKGKVNATLNFDYSFQESVPERAWSAKTASVEEMCFYKPEVDDSASLVKVGRAMAQSLGIGDLLEDQDPPTRDVHGHETYTVHGYRGQGPDAWDAGATVIRIGPGQGVIVLAYASRPDDAYRPMRAVERARFFVNGLKFADAKQ